MIDASIDRVQRWLTRDYLPFLRPYLRWTRQPVTWLLLAAVATLLCGFVLQPRAFWLCAWIGCVILLGLCWPWLAMRGVACRMSFSDSRTTEGEEVDVALMIINRWPWPLWGLALVGGFRQFAPCAESQDELSIETALAAIPAWSESAFHWKFVPPRRGCYPVNNSYLTTGFPFGLWQARSLVTVENRLVAWPRRYAISSAMPEAGYDQTGLGFADTRPGDAGDFLGVRPYRNGDLLKRVHWPQTARQGRLIVCERQAATRPALRILADLRGDSAQDSATNTLEETIRAVASLCEALHQQHARVEYCDAETTLCVSPNNAGLEPVLDRLAMIPYEGLRDTPMPKIGRRADRRHGMLEIIVTADRSRVCRQQSQSRMAYRSWIIIGDDMEPVSQQWEAICREA
jgi:uncharacterized protein (DUF58 family)